MNTTRTAAVKFSVEVITLPVSDVDRALRFYVDRVGFTLVRGDQTFLRLPGRAKTMSPRRDRK